MKTIRQWICLLLALGVLLTVLAGCNQAKPVSFSVIAELNTEEFRVAFRKDDPLCSIVTAAMKELSAEGQLSRLSAQYPGGDYSCMEALPEATRILETEIQPGRKLRVGIQDGVAPLSSSRDDGSFYGLIPDLAELIAAKLGWSFEYMVINSDNVAAELGSGNIDCAWMAASFVESEETCSLSPGWLRNSHEMVVREGSGINRKKHLKGKVLAVTDATSLAALKSAGLLDDKLKNTLWTYGDLISCFNALAAGDCDALVIDSIVENYYM